MGDMGDYWRDVRASRKAAREKRPEQAQKILAKAGIQFVVKNEGEHLILAHNGITADFWPSPRRWRLRGAKDTEFGIAALIRALKGEA